MAKRPLATMFLLFLGATACGGERGGSALGCTQIGCQDYLRIHFDGSTAGQYDITIEFDGDVIECTGTIPTGDGILKCSREQPFPHRSGELDVLIDGTPREVRITVQRDGVPIADETLTPVYAEMHPNGTACPPVCRTAYEAVSLDRP
jgi:hypothetical protein